MLKMISLINLRTKVCKMSILSATIAAMSVCVTNDLRAQDACCFEPTYRLQCETVMEPQVVQRMRLSTQTEFVDEQVTSFRPVLRTRTEQREVKVARPVVETSFREERFTVWKPVVETSFREETTQETTYVNETSEREEKFTTFKPVVETSFVNQQVAVQRPVTETQFYNQRYAVQRPVTETVMQTQQVTSLRPVTTVQNQTVDAGGFVAQQTVVPGQVQLQRQFIPRTHATPGPFGLFARVRGTNVVTPTVTAPIVQTQFAYRPNYITQQVAQTQMVPQTQSVQVPVQVQRIQTDFVDQSIPVQTTRMQTEMVNQKVPVQTTRMVATTEVRKVPFMVTKPVTKTVTRKVPVQQQRWVTEEKVRKVPVQKTRMVFETKKEPIQVSFYEQEAFVQTVRKPVTKQVYVPYTETIMVPRQVVQRTPLSYYDPFSPAIRSGFSTFSPTISSSSDIPTVVNPDSMMSGSSESSFKPAPEVAQPMEMQTLGDSVLEGPKMSDDVPETRMQKIEIGPAEKMENAFDNQDVQDLPAPELKAPTNSGSDSDGTDATEAGFRLRWMPKFAREA